ncbi:hypothetical protein EAE92_15050 [Photorhabdus hainanensis]|nr:hypothetical protein [Photorhabdus hainanensis]
MMFIAAYIKEADGLLGYGRKNRNTYSDNFWFYWFQVGCSKNGTYHKQRNGSLGNIKSGI